MAVNPLAVSLGPLELRSPVLTSSGTWGYGTEQSVFSSYPALGAFVTKGITLLPRAGNPPPRLYETRAGLLNSVGLENVGLENFVKEKLPALPQNHPPMLVNIAGESVEEYVELARALSLESQVAGLEVNVSCPNKDKGMEFGTDPKLVGELTEAVRSACPQKLLIVKLTPNVTDISLIAESACRYGANALSMINTLVGCAVDRTRKAPIFHRVYAGLSGPAIKPVALAAVWRTYEALSGEIPLIGMGGIQNWEDALEFILAGATAVSIGTANFVDPLCCSNLVADLRTYLEKEKILSIKELVGQAHGR